MPPNQSGEPTIYVMRPEALDDPLSDQVRYLRASFPNVEPLVGTTWGSSSVDGPRGKTDMRRLSEEVLQRDAVASFLYFDRGWKVSGLVSSVNGTLVVSSLSIVPDPNIEQFEMRVDVPDGGIDSSILRGVRVGRIAQSVAANVSTWPDAIEQVAERELERFDEQRRKRAEADRSTAPSNPNDKPSALELVLNRPLPTDTTHYNTARDETRRSAARVGRGRRGNRDLGDAFYRRVALAYLDEQQRGKGVYDRLQMKFSQERDALVSEDAIREWVRKAQERGFLGPGARGRYVREPGPNLVQPENESEENEQ